MPQCQLQVGLALACCVPCSLSLLLYAKSKKAVIKLSVEGHGEESLEQDPFDVVTPEDILDGHPVDEAAFWKRMRLRKTLMASLFLCIAAAQLAGIRWVTDLSSREKVLYETQLGLHALFSIYILALVAWSVKKQDRMHKLSVIHLSALTFLAVSFLGITAVLPPLRPNSPSNTIHLQLVLWYTTLALYFVSLVIAITTPTGPPLHYAPEQIYSEKVVAAITFKYEDNVCGSIGASVWETLMFSYNTKVVMLGYNAENVEIGDLPIVPGNMRATTNFTRMRAALNRWKLWRSTPGSGWELGYQLVRVNVAIFSFVTILSVIAAMLFLVQPLFIQKVLYYLERDPGRSSRAWGWVFCAGLFFGGAAAQLLLGQLFGTCIIFVRSRLRLQLNSVLFAKTLVRRDIASFAVPGSNGNAEESVQTTESESKDIDIKQDESEITGKAQVMNLMTTDVDRISELALHLYGLIEPPIDIVVCAIFLHGLLGNSAFFGLGVCCLLAPLNHYAGSILFGAQDNLMKTRDERLSLMNEILGGIRMIKFMAWERSFESRVLRIRDRELQYQKLNYRTQLLWNAIWTGGPILITLVSFWHYAVWRGQVLTPSIAFTSITVFNQLRYALNNLPDALVHMLQVVISVRRVEKYLHGPEVAPVASLNVNPSSIEVRSATIAWPQTSSLLSTPESAFRTPRRKFLLENVSLRFPEGELSLICGKFGSGKSLLLLALLGEVDVLAGEVACPRSPPNFIASYAGHTVSQEDWIVSGVCAYVPQSAWLRNESIRENILFDLPYIEERYQKVLRACALESDLEILEDGDMSEIGERGVNLSGGQKARVSLARAVYSRASVLLLDDVLSAVDAHTAQHLFNSLKGELMNGRTVIMVSHHVQLCAAGAKYIVMLDKGTVAFEGDAGAFFAMNLSEPLAVLEVGEDIAEPAASLPTSSTAATSVSPQPDKKAPSKVVEDERRAIGRIDRTVWLTYFAACGGPAFWTLFTTSLILATLGPVLENGWLRIWTGSISKNSGHMSAVFYMSVYAAVTATGLVLSIVRWAILYQGTIHASRALYSGLLESVLFANIRFHDTVSRGTLLNRFGKDFEVIDSSLPEGFGDSVISALAAITSIVTITYIGGPVFLTVALMLGYMYYRVSKMYGQISRDLRRLDSSTRSPLYSIYGETISGVVVIRAFGASSKFLRDMLRCADTNCNPSFWTFGVHRWLSIRFNVLSCAVVGLTAFVSVASPSISAAQAGFALAFAGTLTVDLMSLVRRFVGLEQAMVAVERIREYSELPREPPEHIEPRPRPSWPENGEIVCKDLVVRYAPELPDVLHRINFRIKPGEKVGILGRTGSGKSTLALCIFRFIDPSEGAIFIDGVNISNIGLTDLRTKLTIIPQDPTILSGTLRSTLDVFGEYLDVEIYEALRRVHLLPSEDAFQRTENETSNVNVFQNLDSPVSEGGENFSNGEKQLLCMARAILKRSKVLVMDEATASVDYATDELIGKTIRQEFAHSTILTIAHRIRTVIDYDRVMLLDRGRVVEFDKPASLLADQSSRFHGLCRATGEAEYIALRKMANIS